MPPGFPSKTVRSTQPTCHALLMHVPDTDAVLAEVKRV